MSGFHHLQKKQRRYDLPTDPIVSQLIADCEASGGVKTDHEARQALASFRFSESDQDLSSIVSGNIRMIVWAAYRYSRDPQDMSDLVQEGVMGFLSGLKKFDLERLPVKPVANYALLYARKFILEYLEVNGRTIRIGRKAQKEAKDAMGRLDAAIHEYQNSDLSIDVVMQHVKRTYRLGALDMLNGVSSLDSEQHHDIQLEDRQPDLGPDPVVELASTTKNLSDLSRQILYALHGIGDETFIECCHRLRVDPHQARRIADEAFANLQRGVCADPPESTSDTHSSLQLLLF